MPQLVTIRYSRVAMKVGAIKKGSARQKIREPTHTFGKSTTSALLFLASSVIEFRDNWVSP
jgi:hypothetical protein